MGHFVRTLFVLSVVLGAGGGRPAAAGEAAAISAPSRESAGGLPGEVARSAAPRLSLVWIDVFGSAPYAFANASREASAILADAGVQTLWTLGDTATVTSGDELKIVLMDGTSKGARLPDRVMGCTSRGGRSRTTWVYLENVLWALGLRDKATRGLSRQEQGDVTRALGRVVAHEIVHAVAPELPHSRSGLMAGRLGRSQLLQPEASFAPAEQKAVRAGVVAFTAPPEFAASSVALATARR